MANMYATFRSVTVIRYQEDAALSLPDREQKGNNYFISGKKGERIDKRTGKQEDMEEDGNGDTNIYRSLLLSIIMEKI